MPHQARRASLRHEQRLQRARLAKLRGGRMLVVRMFRKWVVATQVLKEESRRRSRQEKIWSKVCGPCTATCARVKAQLRCVA